MRMLTVYLALLAGASALRAADDPGVIRVAVRYPGAGVQVVDSTVALPLLRQIHGVEGATHIETESTAGDTCTITVRLDAKADPAKIQAAIRKRVALAEPIIPEPCKRRGITVRADPSRPVEFWFALTSPGDPDGAKFLANFARGEYAAALRGVPGVSDVRVLGTADALRRITLDKEKLRAHAVSVEEVRAAVQGADGVVAISATDSPPKGGPQLIVRGSWRVSAGADPFGEIVVKAGENGQKIVLRDVGRVELGAMTPNELATLDGKPAALLAVTANRDTSPDLVGRTLERLRMTLPPGGQLTTVVTPGTPRVLRLDVQTPDGSTMEYTQATGERVMKVARAWNGGSPAVAFTDGLRPNRAALLVTCEPGADATALRRRLAGEVREAAVRVCDVTGGKPAFPVRVALAGPDTDNLRTWSEAVLARAGKDGIVGDAAGWPSRDVTRHELVFDVDKASGLGVDLSKALAFLSEIRTPGAENPTELNDLFVKNAKGEMVPFSAFAAVKRTVEVASIYRLGRDRAVRISANPADGKSVADCAEALRALAEAEKTRLKLTTDYRAVILSP